MEFGGGEELHCKLGVTSIYVTHDQAEAMVLADRLIVMQNGQIEQQGKPETLYLRPEMTFVAGFLGVTNLVSGRVTDVNREAATVDVDGVGALVAYLPKANRGQLRGMQYARDGV